MRVSTMARLAARTPPAAIAGAVGLAGPIAAALQPNRMAAWRANLAAYGIAVPLRGALRWGPISHHLMLHYESLALIGGRRFDVEVHGEENLAAALAQGRGLLVATAHAGNWIVGGQILHALTGRPIHSVAGIQVTRGWTRELRLAYRRLGLRIHPGRGSGWRLARSLHRGDIVALHMDGDQHGGAGLALRGISTLARRCGTAILPSATRRIAPGVFAVTFGEPVAAADAAVESCVPRLVESLREMVAADPAQWTLFRRLEPSG